MAENDTERSDEARKSEEQDNEARMPRQKKRKIKPTHIAICALAVALVGVLAYFLWPGQETGELPMPPSERPMTGGRGTLLTSENAEEVTNRLETPVEDPQYTVSMTREWVFDTSRTPSRSAIVDNLEHNTRIVYFDVILRDTGEMVYTSHYIPLGGTHSNFALDADLSPGVYEAAVAFFLVDDDFEVVATVSSVAVTLTING